MRNCVTIILSFVFASAITLGDEHANVYPKDPEVTVPQQLAIGGTPPSEGFLWEIRTKEDFLMLIEGRDYQLGGAYWGENEGKLYCQDFYQRWVYVVPKDLVSEDDILSAIKKGDDKWALYFSTAKPYSPFKKYKRNEELLKWRSGMSFKMPQSCPGSDDANAKPPKP